METSGVTPRVAVLAEDLADLVRAEGPFASVYLTTQARIDNAAQQSMQRWKALRDDLVKAGAPDEVLHRIDPVVDDAHLHGETLGIVATAKGTVHVEHHHAPPTRDVGRWAPLPYVVPLIEWRQASPPYVVVVADRQGADLVAYHREGPGSQGNVVAIEREAGGQDFPLRKPQPGGWSQRRYQERAENTWEHNADDVAKELVALVEQVGARLVVVAGDVRAVTLLRDALPAHVVELIREVGGGRSADGSERAIEAETERLVEQVVAEDTAAIIEKFREELGQGDRGVEGVGATLAALAMAQVEVLLLTDDPDDHRSAWFGPDPAVVGTSAEELRGLGTEAPQEGRLVDVAVRAALGTGAGVRVVQGGPADGIGAILRWSTKGRVD